MKRWFTRLLVSFAKRHRRKVTRIGWRIRVDEWLHARGVNPWDSDERSMWPW